MKRKPLKIGERFGRLLVLEDTIYGVGVVPVNKCLCECGTIKEVGRSLLLRGSVRSCGCLLSDTNVRRRKDLSGRRFGRLSVQGMADETNCKVKFWLCRCDCGNDTLVRGGALTRGYTTSCGCYAKEVHSRKRTGRSESGLTTLIGKYRCTRKSRNEKRVKKGKPLQTWKLSRKEWKQLFQQPCHYCGVAPSRSIGQNDHKLFSFNGVDRMDNERGYQPDNVVTCCQLCNRAKGVLAYSEFASAIRQIYQHTRCIELG